MKAFANATPRDLAHAVTLIRQSRDANRSVAIAGGGSDLLGMMKERLVTPDVVVHLKAIRNLDQVRQTKDGVTIGGLITLDALAAHPQMRQQYAVLAEAATDLGTHSQRPGEGAFAGLIFDQLDAGHQALLANVADVGQGGHAL